MTAETRGRPLERPRSAISTRKRQLVAGRFLAVADHQPRAVEGEIVPGLAFEGLEVPQDVVLALRRRLDQEHLAVLGEHEQQIADEQDLAVLVAAALPLALAGGQLDAFGEAVDIAVLDSEVWESCVFPSAASLPRRSIAESHACSCLTMTPLISVPHPVVLTQAQLLNS